MSNTSSGSLISKEDLISMLLGLAIVAIVMVVLVNYFKSRSGRVDLSGVTDVGSGQEVAVDGQAKGESEAGEYSVEVGDSLWNIAVKKYGDGFKWVEIADVNGIERRVAGQLEVGQKLMLPNLPVSVVELPTEHVVTAGESLSKIALSYYGDMFAWEKIYQANSVNIANPDLIEIGMTVVIPE